MTGSAFQFVGSPATGRMDIKMKKVWKPLALLMAATLMLTALTACTSPEKKLLGKWMDSSNMSGYEFQEEGIVELTYANFTVPIVNIPFTGSVKGTYSLGEDDTLTITYSIYSKSITKTYTYSIEDSSLTLVDKESGDRSVYIRQADSTT